MKGKYPLVSIVLTAYRIEYYIRDLIKNLSKIKYPNFEVVIVFDPSSDRSIEIAQEKTKKMKNWRIIVNKQRIGICKSLNLAIQKSRGKYVMFVMTDMVIDPICINKLVDYIENTDDKVAAAVAKTYDFHKHDRIQAYRMYVMPQTGFYYIPEYGFKDNIKYNKLFEGFMGLDGSLVRREIFDKVGMLDVDIELSVTDLDFMWRVWLAGFRVVKIPEAKVYHWSIKEGRQTLKWEYTYAKILTLFIKYYSLKNLIIYIPQLLVIYTARAFITLIVGRPLPFIGWIKSLLWSMKNLPKTLKKRRYIQNKLRVVSDDYLFQKLFTDLSLWDFYKHFRWVQKNITPIMLTEEAKDERILTYTK